MTVHIEANHFKIHRTKQLKFAVEEINIAAFSASEYKKANVIQVAADN
jgi:hypothetical protein